MKIKHSENFYGTCHHGLVVNDSTDGLIEKLGLEPDFLNQDASGKTTREWNLELEDGTPFTIYDWKEYRVYDNDEVVEFHIGTRSRDEQDKVKDVLAELGIC